MTSSDLTFAHHLWKTDIRVEAPLEGTLPIRACIGGNLDNDTFPFPPSAFALGLVLFLLLFLIQGAFFLTRRGFLTA